MADSGDHSRGILVDLDMAQRVDLLQWCDSPAGAAMNIASVAGGTAAFRALDLLRDDSPAQLFYRHDLESFLYVLVWLVTQYEDGHPVVPPYMDISGWCFGSGRCWSDIHNAKKAFLAHTRSEGLSCKNKLARTWIPRLCQMFHSGYAAWDMIQGRRVPADSVTSNAGVAAQKPVEHLPTPSHAVASFDVETLGGHVTYNKFIDILTDSEDG